MSSKLILKSSDGKVFELEEAAAHLSQTLSHIIEDKCVDNEIPIPNITGDILSKVIYYCEKHAESPAAGDEEYKRWDADFIAVNQSTLFYLMLAANFLDIKSLLDLTYQTVVTNMIKGKKPEEIREFFEIQNDFSPEEDEAVRKENQWAFE